MVVCFLKSICPKVVVMVPTLATSVFPSASAAVWNDCLMSNAKVLGATLDSQNLSIASIPACPGHKTQIRRVLRREKSEIIHSTCFSFFIFLRMLNHTQTHVYTCAFRIERRCSHRVFKLAVAVPQRKPGSFVFACHWERHIW